MTLDTAIFMLKIAGTLIMIMISALAFFIASLIKTVDKVNNTVMMFQQWLNDHVSTHQVIDKRLNEHSNNIREHEKDIAVIKNQIKIAR